MPLEPIPLEAAWRWIDANAGVLDAEEVELAAAHGRVPAAAPRAVAAVPPAARAIEDGYAVRAEETLGAGPYNPLSCPLVAPGEEALPRGAVARRGAGEALPAGADAIVISALAEADAGGRVSILGSVAAGEGVARAGGELTAGDLVLAPERRPAPLRPAEIGLLGLAGIARLAVVRRPRTRILAANPAACAEVSPLLRALIERDGGTVVGAGVSHDALLIAGGAERDHDGAMGEMAIRGVAIGPGRETCLGRAGDAVVVQLPALPAACFWAYELVAGRVLRRRGGRDPGFPLARRRFRTTRKIASALGLAEVVPVRVDAEDPGMVTPHADGPAPSLRNAASADGFALVPATSEGFQAGSEISVWLFDPLFAGGAGDG